MTKQEHDTINQAMHILEKQATYGAEFNSTDIAGKYFTLRLAMHKHETFSVAFLTTQHALIECLDMFNGTIDAASVYARPILAKALELNAAALVLAHNHPSGDPTPSSADKALTDKLVKAAAYFDIHILDHIVVGAEQHCSFADAGLL